MGRILVTAIRYCEWAGDIGHQDAIAEGFAGVEQLCEVYARISGPGALERPCWALTFAVAG